MKEASMYVNISQDRRYLLEMSEKYKRALQKGLRATVEDTVEEFMDEEYVPSAIRPGVRRALETINLLRGLQRFLRKHGWRSPQRPLAQRDKWLVRIYLESLEETGDPLKAGETLEKAISRWGSSIPKEEIRLIACALGVIHRYDLMSDLQISAEELPT